MEQPEQPRYSIRYDLGYLKGLILRECLWRTRWCQHWDQKLSLGYIRLPCGKRQITMLFSLSVLINIIIISKTVLLTEKGKGGRASPVLLPFGWCYWAKSSRHGIPMAKQLVSFSLFLPAPRVSHECSWPVEVLSEKPLIPVWGKMKHQNWVSNWGHTWDHAFLALPPMVASSSKMN